MKIRYLQTQPAPLGLDIKYPEGTQIWHILIDFACMPERAFTIEDAYRYHGLDKAWDDKSNAGTYYRLDLLNRLVKDGFIELIETKG